MISFIQKIFSNTKPSFHFNKMTIISNYTSSSYSSIKNLYHLSHFTTHSFLTHMIYGSLWYSLLYYHHLCLYIYMRLILLLDVLCASFSTICYRLVKFILSSYRRHFCLRFLSLFLLRSPLFRFKNGKMITAS